MIVVGSSSEPKQPRHRGSAHGLSPEGTPGNWVTGYMGRELRDPNNPVANPVVPHPDQIYPMAFLVEQDANASLCAHFHVADQFQLIVAGGGLLAVTPLETVTFQFVSPYSSYGPIVAGPEGIHYITLRNRYDRGARHLPEKRHELPPRPRDYRQVIGGPLHPLTPPALAATTDIYRAEPVPMESDGLAAWHYRLPPNKTLTGPNPSQGDGQHWVVLGGSLDQGGKASLERNSCIFVSQEEAPYQIKAGPGGLEILALQYPHRFKQ